MRTSVSSLGVLVIAASIVAPSSLLAQRNVRRSTPRAATSDDAGQVAPPAFHCKSDCGAYSLAVVSAVLPAETEGGSSSLVTLVVENRGGLPAPVATISVAPRNHLALAHLTTIPALAPGERTTVELPVSTAPDGTQCISITITPSPVRLPAAAQFLASAIPEPQLKTSGYGDWNGFDDMGAFAAFADFADFADFVRYTGYGDGGW